MVEVQLPQAVLRVQVLAQERVGGALRLRARRQELRLQVRQRHHHYRQIAARSGARRWHPVKVPRCFHPYVRPIDNGADPPAPELL